MGFYKKGGHMKEKIKNHIQSNKEVYLVLGTTVVVAGITCLIMRGCYAVLLSGADGLKTAEASVTVSPLLIFAKTNNVVTTVHNGTRGNPGFMTRNLDYHLEFSTQADAARAFNISPSKLSSHLNGHMPNVDGLHFERLTAAS
jgi:hypothetical protein